MPAIKEINVAAGTANALEGKKFEDLAGPALITLAASTAAAGGAVTFSVGSEDFLVDAEVNIEASADVVDVERDKILDREPVQGGKMFLKVASQICNYLLIIEEI